MAYLLLAFQVVGFIILVYLMVYLFLSLRRARAASAVEAGKATDPAQMIGELKRAVDKIGQDLNTRSSALERQIEAVDRRGDRLESLLARPAIQPRPARPESRPPWPPTVQTEAPPLAPQPPWTAPDAAIPERPAPVQPSEGTIEPSGRSIGFRPSELHDAGRYQQVFALADQGLTSLEIARRTRVGREEVELLLGLRESEGGGKPS